MTVFYILAFIYIYMFIMGVVSVLCMSSRILECTAKVLCTVEDENSPPKGSPGRCSMYIPLYIYLINCPADSRI